MTSLPWESLPATQKTLPGQRIGSWVSGMTSGSAEAVTKQRKVGLLRGHPEDHRTAPIAPLAAASGARQLSSRGFTTASPSIPAKSVTLRVTSVQLVNESSACHKCITKSHLSLLAQGHCFVQHLLREGGLQRWRRRSQSSAAPRR